jgi:DNA repair exonuclease SbcCD nuclease subunit
MAKALIFSDLHLHAHKERTDRLQDCLEVLEWIFKVAIERKCDYLFFLGDLFHERSKIDVLNYIRTFEVIKRHMMSGSSLEMYLLVGNHDMYHRQRWDVNSIAPISAIPNCYVIQAPVTTVLGGVPVDWMPYTENQITDLEALKKAKQGADHHLLLGHFAVHGAQTNLLFGMKSDVIVEYDNDMVAVDVNVFQQWSATLLGHYHGSQKLNDKVEYVGSPLQLSYGEAHQEKHIILLDLDTLSKEYIVNDFSPKHLIISPQDIEDENYDFNGNFIRLGVDNLSQTGLLDLQREFRKKYKVLSFDIKEKDRKFQEDETVIEESKAILFKQGEMLETYVKETGVPAGLDEKHLLFTGEKVLQRCSENPT